MTEPKRTLFVTEADGEQGSFCDADSSNQYDNTDDFGKNAAVQSARESGTEVYLVDEPIDGSLPQQPYDLDQRFNLHRSERDNQGLPTSAKYSPGR
jgi:hypothetical protein